MSAPTVVKTKTGSHAFLSVAAQNKITAALSTLLAKDGKLWDEGLKAENNYKDATLRIR
jgi:hypothetical protein